MGEINKIALGLGAMVFSLEADRQKDRIQLDAAFDRFVCNEPPDVRLRVLSLAIPGIFPSASGVVFEVKDRWGLYQIEQQNMLVERHAASPALADRLMVFDRDFAEGEVFLRGLPIADSPLVLPNPLSYPLGHVLMVCLLARKGGVMTHACGVVDHGRGYLFAGNSGHGKSTMARLWHGDAQVLNDDRIVVREVEGRFWMYSTPWHGDFAQVSPDCAPLDRIFFLKPGSEHRVRSVAELEATTMLLTRIFPPVWDRDGMRSTLDFVARLVAAVPCHNLEFALDKSVADFVRCVR